MDALLMSTHNICFRGEIRKILACYPLLSRPMIYTEFLGVFVSYARITIIHGYFYAVTFAGSLERYWNTQPSGPVFKHLPGDPANVNAWKTMGDPCNMPQPLLIFSQDYLIRLLIQIFILNDRQCRSRSVGFSSLLKPTDLDHTVCKSRAYIQVQQDQG